MAPAQILLLRECTFSEAADSSYRWWPKPIPNVNAFCRNDPSLRFICFAIFAIGVLDRECCFSSLISAAL